MPRETRSSYTPATTPPMYTPSTPQTIRLKSGDAAELREIDDRSVAEVFNLAPFGCGNPAPLFVALNVEVAGPPVVMKEKHLRLTLRQNGRTLAMKAWNFAERAAELQSGARVDVA